MALKYNQNMKPNLKMKDEKKRQLSWALQVEEIGTVYVLIL